MAGGSFPFPAELLTHLRKARRSNDPAETLAQNPASHALRPHGRAQRFGRPTSA
jgi:hypothetical protein